MRSTLRSVRAIRAVLTAAASLTLVAGLFVHPAGAAKKTTLSITKVSVGKSISVAGKLNAGTDSIGAVQVAKDEGGDDFPPAVPNGTDFTGAWIKADPVKRIVTFSFHLADPNPVFTISPGWVDLWQLTVDGNDTGQHFQIGNIGGFPVPSPGPYALYCTLEDEGFICDHELTPAFGDDGMVEVPISFDLLGAEPGSVIGTSDAGAGIDTLTSSLGTGGYFYEGTDIVGETMAAADYTVPGKVTLGIARAGTSLSKVRATINAKVKGSGFSGSIPRPKAPGSYVVVAKTCYGVKVCTFTGRTITV